MTANDWCTFAVLLSFRYPFRERRSPRALGLLHKYVSEAFVSSRSFAGTYRARGVIRQINRGNGTLWDFVVALSDNCPERLG